MKKSINAWTVDGQTGFEEMFRHIKEAGFDGIELNVDAEGHSAHSLTLATTDAQLDEIAGYAKQYALPIVGISSSMLKGYLMGSPKEDERALAKQVILKQLHCAKALGAAGILIVPGGVAQQGSFPLAYETSMRTLQELLPAIEATGVQVGLENVWNGFFMSPFDMANFIDKAACPLVNAYYDVGNVLAFSWSECWIDVLGARIGQVHVKDFKRNGSLFAGGAFVDLLKGDADWAKIIPALTRAGFDGYLTAEVFKEDKDQSFTDYYKEIADAISHIVTAYA